MTSRAVFVAAFGIAIATSTASHAAITLGNGDSVTLQTILASTDRQVNIGDKTFTFNTFSSNAFSASNIFISGFIANNALDGTGFDITGGFGDTTPGDSAFSQLLLQYTVDVQAPFLAQGYRIKDAGLLFNGSSSGLGSYARVDENIFDGSTPLATLSATAIAGSPAIFQDSRDFSPNVYSRLTVSKDVRFFANGIGSTASASFIRQSFSQRIVPGPGAAAVLGLGGVLAVRRRRA